jgi:hypothetical protein
MARNHIGQVDVQKGTDAESQKSDPEFGGHGFNIPEVALCLESCVLSLVS